MQKFILTLSAMLIVLIPGQVLRAQSARTSGEFSGISRTELELLISDLAVTNPEAVKSLSEDPGLKKKQLESLKQLFAFASEAAKEGLLNVPTNRQELSDLRLETIAQIYDKEINKDRANKPPFASITEQQVTAFWSDASKKAAREAEFDRFFDAKRVLLKWDGSPSNVVVSPEEMQELRNYFAKIHIYASEYQAKGRYLGRQFVPRTELKVKLQLAQFLASLYSEAAADKLTVTPDDVAGYIAVHPEFNVSAKKTKALEVLKRAKAGEDFAALANEFTDDPGNKGEGGELHGGLYSDVKKGMMVPPFEQAALALEPGQISPELVESAFGYHIIKLEKKADVKDANGDPTQVYDVRHILIETMYKDPADPSSRPQPLSEYVKQKLEQEKLTTLVAHLVAANHVSVPDDYTIPTTLEKKTGTAATNKTIPTKRRTPAPNKRRPVKRPVRK